MADLKLLEKLCGVPGISGFEDEIREVIRGEISPCGAEITVTPLGNLLVKKPGRRRPQKKLLLDAHMDEVGMIVTCVTKDGLLKFSPVGGIDRRVLCGRPVTVGRNTAGVIGAKPIHLLEDAEQEKSVPLDELYLDIGAKDREDALRAVKPGDPVIFDSPFDISRGMVRGRALDDRAGCAILIDLIRSDPEYDMWFSFSVQEEVGLFGAATSSFLTAPDASIVLESTTAADIAGVEEEKRVCRVGRGPVISFMDRRTVYDRGYFRLALDTAQRLSLPCQVKQAVAGGNDAGAIHASRGGVRTAAVSLACRYLHSAVGLISQEDFHSAEKLVSALAERIAAGEG